MITINDYRLENAHFPDGTANINLNNWENYPDDDTPINIVWEYDNDAELFSIICLAKKFRKNKKMLTMPYIPHARMDRVKNKGDVFTLKYFCEIINSLMFDYVVVTDPHSSVSTTLLDNCVVVDASNYIAYAVQHIKIYDDLDTNDILMFYPDEGAMKRYSAQSQLPFAFGVKQRNWETGKIVNLNIINNGNEIEGKTVLIVDDICSYGGTFVRAAEKLRELGAARVYLYVTHCEKNIFNGKLYNENSSLLDGVITSEVIGNVNYNDLPDNFTVIMKD